MRRRTLKESFERNPSPSSESIARRLEVELQLGDSDESHIVRTIEYWERELRRWPSRSHTAVLVAEKITSRFFEMKGLLFTKIIDFYEEPEEEETRQQEKLYGDVPIKCFEDYMSVGGKARVWIAKRRNDRAAIEMSIGEDKLQEVTEHLNREGVSFQAKTFGPQL